MTGVEVLKQLRKTDQETKVVMGSGGEDVDIINEAKSLNVGGYIHKPLVLEELERIVMAELTK